MTVETALRQGSRLLEDAGIPAPRLTAEVLLCHALGRERAYLYTHPEEELAHNPWLHYGRYLHERLKGKPTQYITKKQEFYGREFRVSPDVLIPRPETEHVVEAVLRLAPGARTIVDVGCGSGAIAVTLALETNAAVIACDISEAALRVARENARRLRAPAAFVVSDVTSGLRGPFDVIAANPPYIPEVERDSVQREVRDFEPSVALYPGPTGLEVYARLVADAPRVLAPGGWIVMEIGYRLADAVLALFDGRWRQAEVIADLAGLPRVVCARLAP
ncbi:MAG TPA: peptide chain release factor N(5)-glutamine methyltransferase [Solibacterales bacterium]|nr:peptide chain release factor N(5)-glutamine methyltransferase [Bryobacterales bacterium]